MHAVNRKESSYCNEEVTVQNFDVEIIKRVKNQYKLS